MQTELDTKLYNCIAVDFIKLLSKDVVSIFVYYLKISDLFCCSLVSKILEEENMEMFENN